MPSDVIWERKKGGSGRGKLGSGVALEKGRTVTALPEEVGTERHEPAMRGPGASHGTKCPQSRSRNGPTWSGNTTAAMRSKSG